jgi:TetR/AcrR family transcriptional repressor of mexJK operon
VAIESDVDAVRLRIIEAAVDAFLIDGYAGTSTDQIVEGAAISKKTLYSRFGGKEGLFRAVGLHLVDRARAQIVDTDVSDCTTAEQAVTRIARQIAAAILDPRIQRFRRLVIAEAVRFPDVGAKYYEAAFLTNVAGLARVLGQLADRGLLTIDDTAAAANELVGLTVWVPVNRIMLTGRLDSVTQADIDTTVARAVRIFLAAYSG